jgi:hypothetical protein
MKHKSEVVMSRIAIHDIAAVSYLQDDEQHLVIVKAGDSRRQKCTCYVFHCSHGKDAEEICNLIGQVFELVYTEATMEQLDTAIGGPGVIYSVPHHIPTNNMSSPSVMDPLAGSTVSPSFSPNPNPMENELFAVDQMALTAEGIGGPKDLRERSEDDDSEYESESDDELSKTSQQMVEDYMQRLGKTLQPNELKRFAQLLTTYRQGKDVLSFITDLQTLYGESRKFLLPGMRSFIPTEHREEFEQFLVDSGLNRRSSTHSVGAQSKQERRKSRQGMQRAKSKRSGAGPPRLADVAPEPPVPEAPEIEGSTLSPPPPASPPDPNDVDAMLQSIQNEMDDITASFS